MTTNSQNHNKMTASAAASNAQTYGTEVQKSHTRSALGSAIKMQVEQAINTIFRLFGNKARVMNVDADGDEIDIIFKDGKNVWREYWKPKNTTRYLLYKL